ncbi:restriction endonuclease, partial [Rhodococcus pyridinivorans]|uniref:restriction endonuclease n=1 Tax=Rhodococcus pyridinivorans TaxID=103816 RepID=UPI00343B815D
MHPEISYITSAEGAENNAAARMREMGFSDAFVTQRGPDGGIDVRAHNAVAQVKWQGALAGRPELQALYGARGIRHDQKMLFFAASGFSAGAVDYANEVGIALFVYDPIGVLTPQNSEARALLGGSFESPPYRPKMKTVVIWAVATLWFGGLGIVNITGDDGDSPWVVDTLRLAHTGPENAGHHHDEEEVLG